MFWQRIGDMLGITSPTYVRNVIARRNMPIVAVGSLVVAAFAAMLAFCVLTGTPSSIEGFDEAAYENPAVTTRFQITSVTAFAILIGFFIYAFLYLRRKWNQPFRATLITVLFSFVVAMLWGISDSGRSVADQLLIFASIQFLVSGLIVLSPLVSLSYFAITFWLFGFMLDLSGQMDSGMTVDLAYLAFLDILVNWVIYGLFRTSVIREMTIADMSRRDELTGAKNRHYLRDDFPTFVGKEMYVMLCDIDDFKRYNDSYSHDTGDYLLKEFYRVLRDAFGDECTYRYGGDEFLIVSPEFSEADFRAKAEKCSMQLAGLEVEGENAKLTFSGGYVFGTAHNNKDFRDMLHEADQNLLATKKAGKNGLTGAKA